MRPRYPIAACCVLLLCGCERGVQIECPVSPVTDDVAVPASWPVVGQPGRRQAEAIVSASLAQAVCNGAWPSGSRFRPLGFSVADLSSRYWIGGYDEGFGKQPAGLRVRFDNGLRLLFCFNRLVLACRAGEPCTCPYDNDPPRERSEP